MAEGHEQRRDQPNGGGKGKGSKQGRSTNGSAAKGSSRGSQERIELQLAAPGGAPRTTPATTEAASPAIPPEQTTEQAKNDRKRRWRKMDAMQLAENARGRNATMGQATDTDGEIARVVAGVEDEQNHQHPAMCMTPQTLTATRGQPEPRLGPGYNMTPQKLKALWSKMGPSHVLEFYGHGAHAGKLAAFSNFYDQSHSPFDFEVPVEFCACELEASERVVCCEFSEKAIMLCKAAAMGDHRSYHLIRATRWPSDAKALGRQVVGFDDSIWSRIVCSVAFEVVYQKFSKSPELKETLLETGDRVIAEATRNDRIWGIGLDIGDPRCRHPQKWKGTNVLGWALMETRGAMR